MHNSIIYMTVIYITIRNGALWRMTFNPYFFIRAGFRFRLWRLGTCSA